MGKIVPLLPFAKYGCGIKKRITLMVDMAMDKKRKLNHMYTIYIYIFIYLFTNLLSTSIHGYQEKRRKNRQEQEIKYLESPSGGKKKKYHRTKKKRPTLSYQLKKIKRYAVSRSKEK